MNARDLVFIRDLRVETVIGAFEWERRIKQPVFLDLDMAVDNRRAAASDALEDTLDYKAVSKGVVALVESSEFQLVETLAERVAEMILSEFGVSWVRLRASKRGALRRATDVGVVIEREAAP